MRRASNPPPISIIPTTAIAVVICGFVVTDRLSLPVGRPPHPPLCHAPVVQVGATLRLPVVRPTALAVGSGYGDGALCPTVNTVATPLVRLPRFGGLPVPMPITIGHRTTECKSPTPRRFACFPTHNAHRNAPKPRRRSVTTPIRGARLTRRSRGCDAHAWRDAPFVGLGAQTVRGLGGTHSRTTAHCAWGGMGGHAHACIHL